MTRRPQLSVFDLPSFLLAFAASLLLAQAPLQPTGNPLTSLMGALSNHTKTPSQLLDPEADPSSRTQSLNRLNGSRYELSLVPTESVPTPTGNTASVPVRVHFKTATSELEANATAQFVRRGGTWYFANFEFLAFPVYVIVILVGGLSFAITYAVFVLILRNRLAKRGQFGVANTVRMFIPFCWPSLFRQTAR